MTSPKTRRKGARRAAATSAAGAHGLRAPGRGRLWPYGAALAVLAAGAVLLWRSPATPEAVPRTRDNLLLVTLDTTRADRLGCYGHAGARTRHLDRLASEGVRFATVISPAPVTLPAHASLFTGLYPFAHGVRNNGNFYLPDRFPTLATLLKAQGYRTAAFVSAFVLDRRYGLARGFDEYDDRMEGAAPQIVSLEAERRGDRTALALARWIESHPRGQPFFVWLHLYDPHEPYRPPPPFRELFAHDPYDGEVAFVDAAVASILDKLAAHGLLDRTLVAVTADHGESLGEHGEETHSMFVYEAAIRVPLILWRPGRLPTGVVEEPVNLTDLAPTLLDLLGAPPLATDHGRSLVPLIERRSAGPPAPAYSETYVPQLYMSWAPLRSLRDERYKLIDAPRPELYDLHADPREESNLYSSHPEPAEKLRSILDRLTGGNHGAMNEGALDREAAEKLAALGYVGAGAASGPAGPNATDPKEVIGVFNSLRRANSAVRDRRFDESLSILRQVLAKDPGNAFARLVMGSAHMGMGRWLEAVPWYRRYLEIVPSSAYAHQWIAICLLRAGDADGALKEAEAALALDPRFSDARILRGGVLAARGDHAGAISELRAAVETDPMKPILRLDLAKVLDEAGRVEDARLEYQAALRAQADYAPALVGLGVLAAKAGDLDAAARHLRRALEIDPTQDRSRLDLARLLERQGRPAEAADQYRSLLRSKTAEEELREEARARLTALEGDSAPPG